MVPFLHFEPFTSLSAILAPRLLSSFVRHRPIRLHQGRRSRKVSPPRVDSASVAAHFMPFSLVAGCTVRLLDQPTCRAVYEGTRGPSHRSHADSHRPTCCCEVAAAALF